MKFNVTAIALAFVMCGASVAGIAARPASRAANTAPAISLETAVPGTFGTWQLLPEQATQVVNPLVKEELDRLYSQILSRTYVDKEGYRVMLSIAYGDDQRGGLQAHRPEVCYPGQGFQLSGTTDGQLTTAHGDIAVRRLLTNLGQRKEPITYWFTVGEDVVNSQMGKRLAEIRIALTGKVPDGMLFRVSSIDADSQRAFDKQRAFVAQMMDAVPLNVRRQLSGLGRSQSPA